LKRIQSNKEDRAVSTFGNPLTEYSPQMEAFEYPQGEQESAGESGSEVFGESELIELGHPVALTPRLTAEFNSRAQPRISPTLWKMYASTEPLNEGLISFEYPLYHATDEELDYFLGSVIKRVSRAASGVAKTVGNVAKAVGQGVNTITKVVPFNVLTSGLALTPIGMAVRAGLGAASAAASGKNVFQSAVRSLAGDAASRFLVDTAAGTIRGENILKAAQRAGQAGIGDARESLRFAAMVAPFVPGLGTGVAAALGAANALASGERITDALIAGARNAIPGGAIAQTGFDTATNLVKGRNISEALLNAARSRLPGGPAAQAAFDAALTLAKGKSIQEAALAATGRLLPKSPYSADVSSFIKKAVSGENLGRAALSTVGNLVVNRIERLGGPILSSVKNRIPAVRSTPSVPSAQLLARLRSARGPQRELTEWEAPVAFASSGPWRRTGDRLILYGV
jgi:hypothetical protein